MSNETQMQELTNRLKAMALIIKFGHDLFNAKDLEEAAALAVNNSKSLINFKSSSLFEINMGKPKIIAQYGQPTINPHAHLTILESDLCKSLKFENEPLTLTQETGLNPELAENQTVYYAIEIKAAESTSISPDKLSFIWLLTFEESIPNYVPSTCKLLASSISEALFHLKLCQTTKNWQFGHHFSFKKILFLFIILSIILSMFIKIPESVNAEFTLKAPNITTTYAWFDGPIAQCYKQDGDWVKKGELIAEYDVNQISYRLSAAQSAVNEIEAELELEQRAAFTEREKLGQLKLLESRLKSAKIAVEEAQWYLDHSKLFATTEGILALSDGRADLLTGKAIRTGDKIFEIYSGEGMIAEIPVNERESSILLGTTPQTTLFLYTAPERPIPVKVTEISSYPELTEQRTYCYYVRAILPQKTEELRYGMRGIAKLNGEKISLGYSLFKSGLLYLRGL